MKQYRPEMSDVNEKINERMNGNIFPRTDWSMKCILQNNILCEQVIAIVNPARFAVIRSLIKH